jgi:hypothetical protein
MHERVRFITHHGKNILFIDLKGCTAEQIQEIAAQVQKLVTAQPAKSVLSLSDWTDAQITRPLAEQIKKTLVFDQPHVRKTAFVGVDNVPKVFLDAFKTFSRRDFTIFPTLEEAMDWLAEG